MVEVEVVDPAAPSPGDSVFNTEFFPRRCTCHEASDSCEPFSYHHDGDSGEARIPTPQIKH